MLNESECSMQTYPAKGPQSQSPSNPDAPASVKKVSYMRASFDFQIDFLGEGRVSDRPKCIWMIRRAVTNHQYVMSWE